MLKTLFVILISILLLSLPAKAQQQDGSVLERRVSINQQNQPLNYILDQLSWQASVFFSYDASLIDAEKKLSIDINNKSLYTVLNKLFENRGFDFSELENQIIISEKIHTKNIQTVKNDSVPIKYFFLTGKLIDSKKENPIKYASISVLNFPIGTISNDDGEFLLKIHPNNILDTIVISCMGYSQIITPAHTILDEDIFAMNPISIRIKEIKVTSTTPQKLLKNIRNNYTLNYSNSTKLMTAFYRETVKQDEKYINISEAILEVLKAPYFNTLRSDVVRLLKGRKSPDVQPFQWINFKLQGGPFTITKLDAIKTLERFIDKDFEKLHNYHISNVIWYNNHPVYVLAFEPASVLKFPAFRGEMYVHRETFAIVHVRFQLVKSSLLEAKSLMIKKKPRGIKARPSYVQYNVNYQQFQGKWHLATAQASVKFKIRSKRDKLNSEFHSISDLLITDIQPTELKRFTKIESFKQRDVFVEMINNYDERFWENYNIIKPDEDLRNAFKNSTETTN
ncbi:MAG: carboxypeptidase-like regulatory domain-containing protein [Bacteroidetes bacterium]|nr:carboxypeptidase-like regulatory domain-containing protein [Bacteroidota bacterium]